MLEFARLFSGLGDGCKELIVFPSDYSILGSNNRGFFLHLGIEMWMRKIRSSRKAMFCSSIHRMRSRCWLERGTDVDGSVHSLIVMMIQSMA